MRVDSHQASVFGVLGTVIHVARAARARPLLGLTSLDAGLVVVETTHGTVQHRPVALVARQTRFRDIR